MSKKLELETKKESWHTKSCEYALKTLKSGGTRII